MRRRRRRRRRGRRRRSGGGGEGRKHFNDPTEGKQPCTSYGFLLSPMRFYTMANWIIYVSRVGCAVAALNSNRRETKMESWCAGVIWKKRRGKNACHGQGKSWEGDTRAREGGSVGKKGTGGRRSSVEQKDGPGEAECILKIRAKAAG